MMTVGRSAQIKRRPALMPDLKYFPRIACPAGFGALAITVRPPPVTAPATTAYLIASGKFGTVLDKNVTEALSLKAVSYDDVIYNIKTRFSADS